MSQMSRLHALLQEAAQQQAEAFENEEEVSGADLVEWFAEWRQELVRLMPDLVERAKGMTAQEIYDVLKQKDHL